MKIGFPVVVSSPRGAKAGKTCLKRGTPERPRDIPRALVGVRSAPQDASRELNSSPRAPRGPNNYRLWPTRLAQVTKRQKLSSKQRKTHSKVCSLPLFSRHSYPFQQRLHYCYCGLLSLAKQSDNTKGEGEGAEAGEGNRGERLAQFSEGRGKTF